MYKIVSADKTVLRNAINEVEAEVNRLKKEGWSEQGGISVSTTKYGYTTYYTVAQAMKIKIPQYNWGISLSAYKALILAYA